jgi:hypothetical protein
MHFYTRKGLKMNYAKMAVGQRYGKLLVIGLGEREGVNEYHDLVRCACGMIRTVRRSDVQSGKVRSCGCVQEEWRQQGFGIQNQKHGMSRTKLYQWWVDRARRGKRQSLCKAWQEDFTVFLTGIGGVNRMDEEGLTLTRRTPDQPLGPDNFLWQSSSHT